MSGDCTAGCFCSRLSLQLWRESCSAAPELPPPEPPLASPLDYLLYIPLTYFYSIVELLQVCVFASDV